MEKIDQDDKFPELFPDLLYTFLLQLGSSHGPEAASPVLKTWRLVHTGPLPQEMTLQRCSRAEGLEGGTRYRRLGLELTSSFSLGLYWVLQVLSGVGRSDFTHSLSPHVSSMV